MLVKVDGVVLKDERVRTLLGRLTSRVQATFAYNRLRLVFAKAILLVIVSNCLCTCFNSSRSSAWDSVCCFLKACCSTLISFNLALRPSMMSFCCVTVAFRLAMSHTTSSRLVPRPLPPLENTKLGVLLVPVNEVVSFLRLLYALVIL